MYVTVQVVMASVPDKEMFILQRQLVKLITGKYGFLHSNQLDTNVTSHLPSFKAV